VTAAELLKQLQFLPVIIPPITHSKKIEYWLQKKFKKEAIQLIMVYQILPSMF